MARMHPKALPEYIRNDPLREAECEVYDKLGKQLDDSHHVFYSSPWMGLTSDGLEIDGEADFTIAHPDLGMLVIEVKGGRVSIVEDTREWTSTDRHGYLHRIKNPVHQARSGKHNLLEKLKDSPDWEPVWINARHGIILNDTQRRTRDIAPDMPLRIFAFAEDMDMLDQWVQNRYIGSKGISSKCKPLGEKGVFALYMLLSHGIDMRISLKRVLSQDRVDIERLTSEQYQLLLNMDENPRMAIAGAAGTGKTTLALQKAIMCAEKGLQTLLLCYNEPLAAFLKARLSDQENLTISTFHKYCTDMAHAAGHRLPYNRNNSDYFNTQLPDLLLEAVMNHPELKKQAVIIDEGQDFRENWLQTLECVADDDDGVFYVFYDNNQQIQQCGLSCIRTMPVGRWKLNKNLRNTRNVFNLTIPFYTGDPVHPAGPAGQPISFVTVKAGVNDTEVLKQQIGILIRQEGLTEDQIAVLVPDVPVRDNLTADGMLGSYQVCTGSELKPKHIIIESVRRYKGLDSPVIILFRPQAYLNANEMIYTGASRAQVKLVVIGDKDSIGFLESKLPGDRRGQATV